MYTYIEIKSFENKEVVKRLDVTTHSQHDRERIERGMNINLNHDKYYTIPVESETELPTY